MAVGRGIFGSVDMNRGDPQNGWDTDQFPNSVDELALAVYEILRAGGFTTGGFNFDAKLRRQSMDRSDLFHAHIGGIDTLARALLVAADLVGAGDLATEKDRRYAGWSTGLGAEILDGGLSLADLEARVRRGHRTPPALRRAGAPGERRQPAHLVGRPGPLSVATHVLGIDVSTTATKAIVVDEAAGVAGVGSAEYDYEGHGRCGASRTPSCGGTARRLPSARPSGAGIAGADVAAVGLAGQMHGAVLLDEADRPLRPRSSGTTSAPRPNATRSVAASGRPG